jgi:demethylmenaquinone methyltransferase/2-methoxy-6-polyprenyl-1,4-benzoquinol methylase
MNTPLAATTPEERAKRVQTMFTRITRRYDLMNRVMTGGQDQSWRRETAKHLKLGANAHVLDLATGTGDLAFAITQRYKDARVTAFDFSEGILREGARKADAMRENRTAWGVGDALHLPFPDATFDGISNAFLLRNVVDLPQCLRELKRVTKPGGRVVCMEITHPQTPVFKQAFTLYFYKLVPVIGGMIAGDMSAYTYLPNSLSKFPPARPLWDLFNQAGYRNTYYKTLAMGTMAIHVGEA